MFRVILCFGIKSGTHVSYNQAIFGGGLYCRAIFELAVDTSRTERETVDGVRSMFLLSTLVLFMQPRRQGKGGGAGQAKNGHVWLFEGKYPQYKHFLLVFREMMKDPAQAQSKPGKQGQRARSYLEDHGT